MVNPKSCKFVQILLFKQILVIMITDKPNVEKYTGKLEELKKELGGLFFLKFFYNYFRCA
jgi:hypothetical protein